jgi:hypothetical protein
MKTIHSLLILCAAIAISLAAPQTHAQVTNGGFETGTFPPWTSVDSSNFQGIGSDSAFAHSGSRYAFLGATGTIGTLSQTINTTAGVFYTLSFWLANDGGAPPNSFQAFFNGIAIMPALNNAAGFGYTQFFGGFIGTGAPGVLEFRSRNDADFWRLDDVVVGVPESGATALLALPAFAAMLLVRSRRAQKVSVS